MGGPVSADEDEMLMIRPNPLVLLVTCPLRSVALALRCYRRRTTAAIALPDRSQAQFGRIRRRVKTMKWKTPKIREIMLGAEINCYACADLTV